MGGVEIGVIFTSFLSRTVCMTADKHTTQAANGSQRENVIEFRQIWLYDASAVFYFPTLGAPHGIV